jgi:23S rRNA (adenine2503-C2)-methyltransferase
MASESLLDLSLTELGERLSALGLPRYRAEQIWHGIYHDLLPSYDRITTLPQALRERLALLLPLTACVPVTESLSSDGGTRKLLFRLHDGETIETVEMAYPDRRTACLSSQVGCAVGCPLCATGASGFVRDLTTGEIVAQALYVARHGRSEGQELSNVVYMGMGEPLANYDAVLASIRILNDPQGFRLGARSITLSTAGEVPGIRRLAAEGLQINLAVSLHAGNDALRDALVPLNRAHPVGELVAACREYIAATNRRVSFEIALIADVNDSPGHAREVARLLHGLLCHVNLIPYNTVAGRSWHRSPTERIAAYEAVLTDQGIPTTIRSSRGTEIRAGCGQLRSRNDRRTGVNR